MKWVALFDRRFIRGVRDRVLVRLVEGCLVGDERARVDADELAARLEQSECTLDEHVHHFLGGRIVEQESGRDDIKARTELLEKFGLAGVGAAILDFLRRVRVFLVVRQVDHVLRDVDANDGARRQITVLPCVEAFTAGQIADIFFSKVFSNQTHNGGRLRLCPEREHL